MRPQAVVWHDYQTDLPQLGRVLGSSFSSELRPQSASSYGIDGPVAVDDAAVIRLRCLRCDITTVEVTLHGLGRAMQRVAKTRTAGKAQFGDFMWGGQCH